MLIRSLFLSLSILLICSCNKEPQLSVGQFTCLVNGEAWRGTDPEIDRTQEGLIEFTAEDTSFRFLIELNDNDVSAYDLTAVGNITTLIDLADEGLEEYSTQSGGGENSGTLNISIINTDDAPKTMSGTFSFTAHKIDGSSITITNGIFNKIPFLD